ncbi:NAD(P)-binding protein [Rhizodiscina lignyota]|uniref:NAD(P)-binding protein n=1 Tax=Rhizodiscina lignyota TaxID=1504668 RepID=A0A9P4IEP1_9PEZI|nr:NAD(P)-binding protein [Rhizodiscina lignyota]
MENIGSKQFADFDLGGGVFIVTGGAQGLGLAMAEGLVEAGGKVYCLDRQTEPEEEYLEAEKRVRPEFGGEIHYQQVDVRNNDHLNSVIAGIAERHQRLDGVVAAAAIQQIRAATDYTPEDVREVLDINYTGAFMTATAAARQMFRYKCRGSVCLIASMSGHIANKGLITPVYNSSKAAVIQLARNLAMEWSKVNEKGEGGIRVNSLSPGNILTPMVLKNFEEKPELRTTWESENMLGRLSTPEEYKGATLFLLSKASSFMTGANMVIDGGYTAW